jgi:tetratricopeptide (TPR) repeat protein
MPDRKKIHTVIFAGSVLPPSFPWYKYLQSGAVGRVVNECGWEDSVLVLCQSTALLMGMAGRIGFRGMVGDRFVNRYYMWGHGGYFNEQKQFMREEWVPLLTRDGPVPTHDERPPLTAVGGVKLFLLSNMHVIKVAAACLLMMMTIFIPLDWYRKVEYQKRVERINHIALLTNAQEIPGRDPSHVRDLLKIDARASGNENAIDNLIGTESPNDSWNAQAIEEEAEPRWWESLPGMADSSREAFRARLYHHQANHQLVASNQEAGPGNRAKALAYYQSALTSYKRINDNDPAHGSYALCLMDFAQLLATMADHDNAIKQFQLVRDGVFPPEAKGKASNRPASLEVDSLIMESRSWKALQNWTAAADCLQKAIAIAKKIRDQALLSDAHIELALLHIDRLEVHDAVKNFQAAEDACRAIMRDQVVYKIRLFHIRHGLALANRLTGKSTESYEQYRQIVMQLQELITKDVTYTPKQRRELRERLINSMERRADVRLFAGQDGATPPPVNELSQVASFARHPSATNTDEPTTVEEDYQEAIELVGNDDLGWKVRLLFKKVIARFVAELEDAEPIPVAQRRGRHKALTPIDLEFDEAKRTFKTLPAGSQKDLELYGQIAYDCMAVRASAMPSGRSSATGKLVEVAANSHPGFATPPVTFFSPHPVERLRARTVKLAADCENLTRDKVEMLLLAHEILVRMRIEPDSAKRAADATRMLAVLGVSTNVASHAELAPYFERFQRIATQEATIATNALGSGRFPSQYHESMKPIFVSPEVLRFTLQLGPWLELKLTTQRLAPQAVWPSIDASSRRSAALNQAR